MAALLDALSIDKVVIMGVSGGGPTTLNFALRHPDRCSGCLTEVAVSGSFDHPKLKEMEGFMMKNMMTSPYTARMSAYTARNNPKMIISEFLKNMSSFEGADKDAQMEQIMNDPERMENLRRMMDGAYGLSLYQSSGDAMVNDLYELAKPINYEGIRAPTLVVHGKMDGDIPFSQAEQSSSQIPGAELYGVENGWHVMFLAPEWKEVA